MMIVKEDGVNLLSFNSTKELFNYCGITRRFLKLVELQEIAKVRAQFAEKRIKLREALC